MYFKCLDLHHLEIRMRLVPPNIFEPSSNVLADVPRRCFRERNNILACLCDIFLCCRFLIWSPVQRIVLDCIDS